MYKYYFFVDVQDMDLFIEIGVIYVVLEGIVIIDELMCIVMINFVVQCMFGCSVLQVLG